MKAARLTAAIAALTALGSVAAAWAGTLHVANYGADSPGCGAKTDPCRTLTQAISNAGSGDTVLVGPGRYGDVNGDGSFDAPDDETPNVGGCGCVVSVSKPLKVLSRDGAAATVIDANGAGGDVVRISADGVRFGEKNKGFTVTRAQNGLRGLRVASNGDTVAGNVATGNTTGLSIEGSGNTLTSNRATDNSDGFSIGGPDNEFADCVAARNGIGFNVGGSNNAFRAVIAIANDVGISLLGSGHTFTASSAIGNGLTGIDAGAPSDPVITRTNMFGNGTDALDGQNCGLSVADGVTAVATRSFWGAATGPGADPSDDVCLQAGATATTAPFATKEIKAAPKPLR
jgi:parallel beta-helix repeat protein